MPALNHPFTFGNKKNAIVSKNRDLVTNCKQKHHFYLQIITSLIIKQLAQRQKKVY